MFRRGVSGSHRDEMTAELEARFWRHHEDEMTGLGYLRSPARS
jgi:hypothetical protein